MFRSLFNKYKKDIQKNNLNSEIWNVFLYDMNEDYLKNTTINRKVIDFIAGMTDDYMRNCYINLNKEEKNV